MNLLFLGGTGNLSTACARACHERGHHISVLTRGHASAPPEYETLVADRKDLPAMRTALAGRTFDSVLNFIGFDPAEVQADWELFRGATGQYIFISSATVYEKPPRELPIREDTPLGNAWWEYARKKIACEEWLMGRFREDGFPVTIIRPSHTYSREWIPNLVSSAGYSFAARLERGEPVFVADRGTTPWTLTHADDFAVGVAGLAGCREAIGEAVHITGDEALPWKSIYQEIAAALGLGEPQIAEVSTDLICEAAPHLVGNLRGDKIHPAVFDNSKIKRLVPEFHARKSLAAGIRESVAWMRGHPERQRLNPQIDATNDAVIAAWRKAGCPAPPQLVSSSSKGLGTPSICF
jgi:nucleoside-diphosphate-sugar epimerase